MEEKIGFIHSVESFGALDGPGIRYVVFLQGCPLRCRFCHNPDTWNPHATSRTVTAGELVDEILDYRNFIRSGGVTLSGGEPLLQADFVRQVCLLCRENGIHTAVDTSGSILLSSCRGAVDAADLVLLDIKALGPRDCKNLTGQDNTNALRLLDYCESAGKAVWIRHVLVPGVTLDSEKLEALARFLKNYICIKRVELLPFHKMGEYKWKELGFPYTLYDTPAPSADEVKKARMIFEKQGFPQ